MGCQSILYRSLVVQLSCNWFQCQRATWICTIRKGKLVRWSQCRGEAWRMGERGRCCEGVCEALWGSNWKWVWTMGKKKENPKEAFEVLPYRHGTVFCFPLFCHVKPSLLWIGWWSWCETWRTWSSLIGCCRHTLQTWAFGCKFREGLMQSGDLQVWFCSRSLTTIIFAQQILKPLFWM